MAHPRIVAQRQAVAVGRLMAAARKLAKRHDLKQQGEALDAITVKHPAMAQMLQAEALADLLEGLAGTPAGDTAAPDETVSADAPRGKGRTHDNKT